MIIKADERNSSRYFPDSRAGSCLILWWSILWRRIRFPEVQFRYTPCMGFMRGKSGTHPDFWKNFLSFSGKTVLFPKDGTGHIAVELLLFTPFTVTWSKCIPNHLRWWHFAPYVSGFCHIHGKTPRGILPVNSNRWNSVSNMWEMIKNNKNHKKY